MEEPVSEAHQDVIGGIASGNNNEGGRKYSGYHIYSKEFLACHSQARSTLIFIGVLNVRARGYISNIRAKVSPCNDFSDNFCGGLDRSDFVLGVDREIPPGRYLHSSHHTNPYI